MIRGLCSASFILISISMGFILNSAGIDCSYWQYYGIYGCLIVSIALTGVLCLTTK